LEEVRARGVSEIRLTSILERGRLRVLAAERCFLEEVEARALELGESEALSEADKELLALALQLRHLGVVEVVSDDYSIQNMAEALGVPYSGLTTRGIRRRFRWLLYCPGCRRIFHRPQPGGVCPYCGSEIRRKPVETTPLKGEREGGETRRSH
jgi:UPF0271 protein